MALLGCIMVGGAIGGGRGGRGGGIMTMHAIALDNYF